MVSFIRICVTEAFYIFYFMIFCKNANDNDIIFYDIVNTVKCIYTYVDMFVPCPHISCLTVLESGRSYLHALQRDTLGPRQHVP